MARSQRLLDLLQLLRTHRYAVTAETVSRDLGVSVRTVYRDIATLQSQGAPIEGEAGVGYVLRPGFVLPPLMFTSEELEALVLGVTWVGERPDIPLARSAKNLVAKVKAVLPAGLRRELEATTLLVGPAKPAEPVDPALAAGFRKAIREEKKLHLVYRDDQGRTTDRTVWPFGMGYFESLLVLMAWCELRQDLRNFRADRVVSWSPLPQGYGQPRSELLARWCEREGVDPRTLSR